MKTTTTKIEQLLIDLNIRPYPFAQIMGDDDVFMYRWHTIHGLVRINTEIKTLEVFAIANDEMHNGKFVAFIEMLERNQDDNQIIFGVSEFFNARLRDWFKRRGYHYEEHSDTMFYRGKLLTQRNTFDKIEP